MFDKKYMMNDEYGRYVRDSAKEVPITLDRMNKCIDFISDYIRKHNIIIERYEEEDKDTKHLVYERDYALFVLGLDEEPERYWMDKSNDWLGNL